MKCQLTVPTSLLLKKLKSKFVNKCRQQPKLKAKSHCSDNENIMTTTQRECILLVELLPAEYTHAHSTNPGRALLTFLFFCFCYRYRVLTSSFSSSFLETLQAIAVVCVSFLSITQHFISKTDFLKLQKVKKKRKMNGPCKKAFLIWGILKRENDWCCSSPAMGGAFDVVIKLIIKILIVAFYIARKSATQWHLRRL